MRVCPTVDGLSQPLISHRIGAETCLSRQQCNYHKCHRCLYRGKPASWEPEVVVADQEITVTMTAVAARGVPIAKVPVPKRHAEEAPASGNGTAKPLAKRSGVGRTARRAAVQDTGAGAAQDRSVPAVQNGLAQSASGT